MESLLRILGDGLSIASLAIIFSMSSRAFARIKPDAKVPLFFNRQGEPGARAGRGTVLWGYPVLAAAILFMPTVTMMTFEMVGDEAIMLFAMRGIMSAALALRHIVHMQKTLQLLEDEGQLVS